MDPFPHRREAFVAGVPSKNVVVPVVLAPAGFHHRNTGQQTPIQVVAIGGLQKDRSGVAQRAIAIREELFNFLQPRVVLYTTRLRCKLGYIDHNGKSKQTTG